MLLKVHPSSPNFSVFYPFLSKTRSVAVLEDILKPMTNLQQALSDNLYMKQKKQERNLVDGRFITINIHEHWTTPWCLVLVLICVEFSKQGYHRAVFRLLAKCTQKIRHSRRCSSKIGKHASESNRQGKAQKFWSFVSEKDGGTEFEPTTTQRRGSATSRVRS